MITLKLTNADAATLLKSLNRCSLCDGSLAEATRAAHLFYRVETALKAAQKPKPSNAEVTGRNGYGYQGEFKS